MAIAGAMLASLVLATVRGLPRIGDDANHLLNKTWRVLLAGGARKDRAFNDKGVVRKRVTIP
jgi:hypothetical protein